jgi:hypothetical protein
VASPSRHGAISVVSKLIAGLLVGVQSGDIELARELSKNIRQLPDPYRQSPANRSELFREILKRLSDEIEVNTIHFGHGPKFRLENIKDDCRPGPGSFPYRQMVAKPQIPL